jgi:TPR repeat protein
MKQAAKSQAAERQVESQAGERGRSGRRRYRRGLLDRLADALSPAAALRHGLRLADENQSAQAFRLLARAARAGLAEGEYRVGRCYLEGSGVPVSRADALHWLTCAAVQGHIEAQWRLAVLCLQGFGPSHEQEKISGAAASLLFCDDAREPDFVAAEKWARLAAEAGSGDGQAILAYILASGPETMRDLEAAHRWYEQSAKADCPQGALGYALLLAPLVKDEAGQRKVADHVRRAAEAGLATALYLLGDLTRGGIGVERSDVIAADLYRQAAEKGSRSGQARWGLALIEGLGVERDPTEGESWLRRAAMAGDPEAAARLGDLYARAFSSEVDTGSREENASKQETRAPFRFNRNGKGSRRGAALPPNHAEAAIWYRRAAEAGHRTAARALGLLYLTGAGVARDPDEAARWLRISAQAGDLQARADLANLSLRGVGNQDPVEARQWLEQAAASGNLAAAFNLGVCLAEGLGAERDENLAAQWMRRAADGVVNAQYCYGRMLVEGRGVQVDAREGRAWIARAAGAGMVEAEVALAEMMANGRGGSRDPLTARALLEKAARKGHVGAASALNSGLVDVPSRKPI